jgi:hypothetical protein
VLISFYDAREIWRKKKKKKKNSLVKRGHTLQGNHNYNFFPADPIAILNIPTDKSHLAAELSNSRSPEIHPLDFGFQDPKKRETAIY